MLDGEVLLAFEKQEPVLQDGIPMFNLRLGAKAVDCDPSEEIISLASNTQKTLGLRLTTVDIVELENGELKVLEVNDGFSLEHYMKQDAHNVENARHVYDAIIAKLFE
jgi:glutathione synthase/RimK-type ligase-like ATP-grasp enzyme